MALWGSLQVKFGLSYIAVIAAVLLLLNTYPLLVSEDLVFHSKETNMTGSVSVVVYSLAGLNRLNQENVAAAMAVVEETGLSRVLVTDSTGLVLYDTRETGSAVGKYTFYSEIVQALEGYDAFSCSYRDDAFRSRTASPVLYQNRIIGAVYAYEYDTEQAALLEGLQSNLLKLSAGIAAAVVLLPELVPYAMGRLSSWRDPFADPLGEGHQTIQSLYAIASGGAAGLGLGNSRQKYLYVPEPQNDFIFSILCEELGFVGAALTVVLFLLLFLRGMSIAVRARDKFGALLAVGFVVQVVLQAVLNIAVVTNTIPNTGISLPFFSSGGTSLMMLLGEMGIVLSVSRQADAR